MREDNALNKIAANLQQISRAESDIDRIDREHFGEPTSRQQDVIADLELLYESLRGPEDMLDENYSRPIPKRRSVGKAMSAGSSSQG